jgi:hypothetical protein
LGYQWGEIERRTNTPRKTLWRWSQRPEWAQMERDWLEQDPLVRRAKAVVARALDHDLHRKGRPDTSLAERILAPRGNGNGEGVGYSAHPGVVLLPMKDTGLESRPATQVLMQAPPMPAPAPQAPPKRVSKRGRPGRPRVAGPDE